MIMAAVLVICSFSSYAVAEGDNNEQAIIALIDSLLEYNSMKIRMGIQTAQPDSREMEILGEMEKLGAEMLSESDINQILANHKELRSRVGVPSSSSDIQWISTRINKTVNGTQYEVQHISAIARTTNTNLAFGGAQTLYSGQNYPLDPDKEFVKIYVQKAIGMIPIVQWLPYEFFFTNAATSDYAAATYTGLTSACFSFVKPYGQSDSYQQLMLTSNYLRFSGTIGASGVANGSPCSATKIFDQSTGSEYFASTDAAISAYLINTQKHSFIPSVTMAFAYNGSLPQCSLTLQVPMFIGMGQVY